MSYEYTNINCKLFSIYRLVETAFKQRYDCPLSWMSVLFSMASIIGLMVLQCYPASMALSIIVLINFYVVVRESYRSRTEVYRKTRLLLSDIKVAAENTCYTWQANNYPHLYSPISPCISLQWTYRDGAIVNLPWALLVRGDSIVMRSGHTAPGPCREVNGKRFFKAQEIYGLMDPKEQATGASSHKPTVRAPIPDLVCVLENTPYLENLKLVLLNCNRRPPTIYNQQRYVVSEITNDN